MSLLAEAFESCVILNKTSTPDGYGGYNLAWTEGTEFQAAIVFDSSIQAKIAENQGVKDLYTVITRKSTTLSFNDVFKRLSDGKTLKVTSNGQDKKTPDSAGLNMRVVSAQEFELPNNGGT